MRDGRENGQKPVVVVVGGGGIVGSDRLSFFFVPLFALRFAPTGRY